MNSIQLISKINSRIEDLAMLSQEILKPNSDLSNIEKEVIKRNCSELYELVLKLKTSNDLSEEQLALKENLSQEIKNELSFKEVINNSFQDDSSINTIAESTPKEPVFELEDLNIVVEPIIEVTIENIYPIGEILAEIKEEFYQPIVPETETIKEIEIAELIIEENINIEKQLVYEDSSSKELVSEELVYEANMEVFEDKMGIPAEEVMITETVITHKKLEIPVFETKLVNEEQKEKPSSFFSIGKTVLPKTEPSLNDIIAQKMDGFQLSEKVIEPKIDNLKTAISLNKKIAFVNELFKENVVDYAKSIDKINSSNNLSEAMLIWTELKVTHNWNNENTLVKDLEKLIQRRFS